jgi:hypothetical protein
VNDPSAITGVVSGLAQSIEFKFQVLAFTVKDGRLSNSLLGLTQPVGKYIKVTMWDVLFKIVKEFRDDEFEGKYFALRN